MTDILFYLENADLMRQLRNKKDKYIYFGVFGTGVEYALRTRLQDAFLIARTFGIDGTIVAGILFGIAYSWPVYGEQGAEVLRELDPDYSRCRYAQILIRKLLNGIETDATEIICTGIRQVMEGLPEKVSNETLTAYLIDNLYNQVDRLPTIGQRNIVANDYIKATIKRSAEAGRLLVFPFPKGYFDRFELNEAVAFDPETAHTYMTKFYNYYLTHFDEIPEKFRAGFEHESPELITACYLSTRNRLVLENVVRELEKTGKI